MKSVVGRSVTSIRRVDPLIYFFIIVFLVVFVSFDVYIQKPVSFDVCIRKPPDNGSRESVCTGALSADAKALRDAIQGNSATREDAQHICSILNKWDFQEDRHCGSIIGHLPSTDAWSLTGGSKKDPWMQMKWVGKPAKCRVKGHVIEALDDVNNFRRGYSLKYHSDVEDKTHILPWLLGSRQDLNLRKRRVLVDLGGNMFNTSIQWFMRMYPCDFTEVHVFENTTSLFQFPTEAYVESSNVAEQNTLAVTVNETPGIPKWMIDRIKLYNVLVSDTDDPVKNAWNITRFMKEELHLTAQDTVVVKMDIEGSEWDILPRWMDDSEMSDIVDELFVEIHYSDFSMGGFGWLQFRDHTREQAVHLLAGLRAKGFFAHAWP